MKQQIKTPCGKPIRYAWKTPHKFLEKFSKNFYGTTGGTYSSRFLRPVMNNLERLPVVWWAPRGGGVLHSYLGIGEPLMVWNPDPV